MIYDPCHAAGGMTAYEWERDPRRIGFILARYKFVAKMFEGMYSALEIGCADGFGSRVVRQAVQNLTAIDLDEESILEAKAANQDSKWEINFCCGDIRKLEFLPFDAAFALDVLEHIHPTEQQDFLEAIREIAPVAIFGCPSLESQEYASALSKEGHINCKTGPEFKAALQAHWKNVFVFGMNDEVLHTGFAPMQQYRFGVCC